MNDDTRPSLTLVPTAHRDRHALGDEADADTVIGPPALPPVMIGGAWDAVEGLQPPADLDRAALYRWHGARADALADLAAHPLIEDSFRGAAQRWRALAESVEAQDRAAEFDARVREAAYRRADTAAEAWAAPAGAPKPIYPRADRALGQLVANILALVVLAGGFASAFGMYLAGRAVMASLGAL